MHRTVNRTWLALMAGVFLTSVAHSANWTRFRGPNGTGIANDQDLPIKWTKENVLWKAKVPGIGHSSPIIWEDKVFLQSAAEDGTNRMLVCMSAKDGKVLWTRPIAAKAAHHRRDNSWASSTPATDGERVYANVWDGERIIVYAWDLDGELKWKAPLGSFKSQHGAGTSPVVYDGKVLINFDRDRAVADVPEKSSALIALDAKSGKEVWRSPRTSYRVSYAAPFVVEKKGADPQVIAATSAGVTGYNLSDGKEIWNCEWNFRGKVMRTVGSPIYTNGLILATTGDGGGGRHAMAVKADGTGDVTETGLAWEKTSGAPYVPTPLTLGEYVYGIHDYGFARCYHAKTGKVVWEKRVIGKKDSVYSSPVLVDGNVIFADVYGKVRSFKATSKGYEPLGENDLGEPIQASLAVANKRLYVRGKEHLFCIGKK